MCFVHSLCLFSISFFREEKRFSFIFTITDDSTIFSLDCTICFAQLLGLMNSHWLLTFLYIGGQIPMNTYLMKGYIDSIPIELDEGARIDGASNTKIFMQIIMPLSRPMIAVVAMNGFIIPLADFVLASTILRTPES